MNCNWIALVLRSNQTYTSEMVAENINNSTQCAKDAANTLHELVKVIVIEKERETKKKSSKNLTKNIDDFNHNVKKLQTALRDIEVFQADLPFKEQRCGRTREDDGEVSYLNYELDKMRRRNKTLQDQLNDINNGMNGETRRTEDLKRQLSACQQQLMVERTEKDKTKTELEDALTRLSAIASSKLRDNNPNVVDLSDQNRPSKIAEQLSELYDNEWTVAYEVLEDDLSEKECIATLLKILMDVYNECNQLATEGFYERVQQSIESPFSSIDEPVKTEVKMSDYLKQQIKEIRKYRAKFAIKGITKVVAPKIQGDIVDTSIQAYICKCINICWYMVVQDPPLVFSCGSSGEFDTNVFRSYTRRGRYVDYVVWPALLVSDGSMLSKGIAQGCTSNVDTVSSTDI